MANRPHCVKTSLNLAMEEENTEVIFLVSAEHLLPVPLLVHVCVFLKFYCLQEIQMLYCKSQMANLFGRGFTLHSSVVAQVLPAFAGDLQPLRGSGMEGGR